MIQRHRAVGVHIFAGGFTLGVQNVMDVDLHLETHDFGRASSEVNCGVHVERRDHGDWPEPGDALMACGNPRCTAFSCLTSGSKAHGAWAPQTRDAIELCQYAAGRFDFVVWESVQQAYTIGKPFLDWLISEHFAPRHYRIAHLFVNTASFGNSQNRKRYFFVAYRDSYKFNVSPPPMPAHRSTLWDAIGAFQPVTTAGPHMMPKAGSESCCPDCWPYMIDYEREIVPRIPNGWNVNDLARCPQSKHLLSPVYRVGWDCRTSNLPFSLYGPSRLRMDKWAPTVHSGSRAWQHPWHDRSLTVAELSAVMGWPPGKYPVGRDPAAQLGKGIVPAVCEWLARQVVLSYENHWGGEDFESSWCPNGDYWYGLQDASGKLEKRFDLTKYYPRDQDWSRFPAGALTARYPVQDGWDIPRALDNRRLYGE